MVSLKHIGNGARILFERRGVGMSLRTKLSRSAHLGLIPDARSCLRVVWFGRTCLRACILTNSVVGLFPDYRARAYLKWLYISDGARWRYLASQAYGGFLLFDGAGSKASPLGCGKYFWITHLLYRHSPIWYLYLLRGREMFPLPFGNGIHSPGQLAKRSAMLDLRALSTSVAIV